MSSRQTNTNQTELGTIAEAIRKHDRFLVTTHENPDGDALGSLLATTLALRSLGKDAVMYLGGAARIRTSETASSSPSTQRTSDGSARRQI